MFLLLGSAAEPDMAEEAVTETGALTPGGGGTPPPVLGDDDNAAMLTPVLLAVFAGGSGVFCLPLSCPFCLLEDDLVLLFDFEEDVVEVDLSSFVLPAGSFAFAFESNFAVTASDGAPERALVSLALGAFTGLVTLGVTVGDG